MFVEDRGDLMKKVICVVEDEKDLNRRQAVFAHHTKTTKGIHPILLTTYPPIENVYLRSVQKVITMEELFR